MNFSIYWQHADAVSKTLYFILLAMSIATWTVFILRIDGDSPIKATSLCSTFSGYHFALKAKLTTFEF